MERRKRKRGCLWRCMRVTCGARASSVAVRCSCLFLGFIERCQDIYIYSYSVLLAKRTWQFCKRIFSLKIRRDDVFFNTMTLKYLKKNINKIYF